MSLESVQYRSVIRFLFLKGKSQEEVLTELSAVYGGESPSKATIYWWYNYFQSGRTSVIDEDRSERPCEIAEKITERHSCSPFFGVPMALSSQILQRLLLQPCGANQEETKEEQSL
jgi:hypothetical protein